MYCSNGTRAFALVIVPSPVSYYMTADRVLKTQERDADTERINPVLALVLAVLFNVFGFPYDQTHVNKVWDAEGGTTPPIPD